MRLLFQATIPIYQQILLGSRNQGRQYDGDLGMTSDIKNTVNISHRSYGQEAAW